MDKNKIFLINRGELKGYLCALFFNEKEAVKFRIKKLKEVAFYNPNSKINNYSNDDFVDYVGLPETGDLEINSINKRKYFEVKGRNVIKNEDILFARIEPSIFNKKYIYASGLSNITFTSTEFYIVKANEEFIKNKFLFYMLFTDYVFNQYKGKTTGSTGRRRLDKDIFLNIRIPVPSKDIQQNIIDMMDKAYESKKQKEKEAQDLLDGIDDYLFDKLGITIPSEPENDIENRTFKVEFDDIFADRLDADSYTSYYQNIFETFEKSTCKFTTLKTITKKIKTGTTPDQKLDAFTTEKEIVFLRNSDIQDGEIIEDKFKYIKNDLEKYLTFSYKNEIIICIAGTIGISALNTFDRLAINQNVSSLIIDETQININFLIYWLNTKVAISLLKRLASIATIAYVNNPTLLRLQIPLPTITIQDKIADEIKQRRQKAKQLQNEAKLELENAKKEVEKIILGDSYEC